MITSVRRMRRFPPWFRRWKSWREIPFPSSPPGEKYDRAEKLREAKLFAGMEMTVDFDLTRWNLITLRTGTCSSGTRNEACRRSRVDDDDDVKVRYEIHRRSFSSEGPPKERYPYFCLISSLTFDDRHDTPVYICRITLSETMGLAPISRCDPIRRLNSQNHRLRLLILS